MFLDTKETLNSGKLLDCRNRCFFRDILPVCKAEMKPALQAFLECAFQYLDIIRPAGHVSILDADTAAPPKAGHQDAIVHVVYGEVDGSIIGVGIY